ncbi:hypothetical protein [Sediminibacillus massiliensis]|uniref:hypothetical protein n=1 Tax=Sediminibacillus massiliensis TaxID=1926277 RepID=UPI000988629A|nr:hypothetical protein [Sediminibacillus massiliensis]
MLPHFNKTVMKELYKEWMKWSIWLFGVIITIRVVLWILDYNGDEGQVIDHFMYFMNDSSRIFLFVVGIMMVFTFLRYYIELGLTRRTYFIGGTLASFMTSLTIGLISVLLAFLERFLLSQLDINYPDYIYSNSFGYWVSFFLLFVTTSWLFYMVGWFIGHVFYRYKWWKGMFAIGFSVVLLILEGIVTGDTVTLYGITLENHSLPIFFTIIIMFLLSAGMLAVNYRLVKDIRVKMK